MKKNYKRSGLFIGVFIAVYLLLVLILYIAESFSPKANIHSFGDALWYSLETLSTVGYGDVTPVTITGRIIGVIFLLMATGVIVALFGAVFSFVTGEAMPLLFLSFLRKKNWYYFADFGPEAHNLARNIHKEDDNAVIIFGQKSDELQEKPDYRCVFLNVSPARVVTAKKGVGTDVKVFFMKENDIGVNQHAMSLPELSVEVYARTVSGQDTLSGNVKFFHSYDCCARQYWRMKPFDETEDHIVIIGFGLYGQAILERAIITNVIKENQNVAYHIFGDGDDFMHMHPELHKVFQMGEECADKDSIIFHKENWQIAHDLLKKADRIIICDDDDEACWDIYWMLQRYYALHGRVDIRSNRAMEGVSYFGTYEQIYTPKQILRTELNIAAEAMNDLYRQSTNDQTIAWKDLDDFLKQSKIAAADHLLMKIRILHRSNQIYRVTSKDCEKAFEIYQVENMQERLRNMFRRIEHMRWLRFYTYYNWTYGEERDDINRQHPNVRPYEELTEAQKAHNDFAWKLLGEISEELRRRE